MTQALPDHMRRNGAAGGAPDQPLADVDPGLARLDGRRLLPQHRRAGVVARPRALRRRGAHTEVHALEHVTFVATATLFWWMALGASRRSRRGLGVLAVFAATLPATALGILLTLARTPWYAPYGHGATALRDQQVAGALMWGFGGSALVVGAAALFASWLANMDRLEAGAASTVSGRAVVIRRLVRWFDDRLGASRFARDRRSTRCSRTTGRSCWARSRCTASSSSSSPGSTSRSSSSRATRPSCTTAATRRCAASQMSQAYESTVRLSFDVRAGLVMRQIHHWAALVFLATIVAHLCRIFFTGAFRRPREINWVDRRDAPDPRHLQRLRRLLAPRRPVVGDRPAHRVLHRAGDPGDRHLGGVPALRR